MSALPPKADIERRDGQRSPARSCKGGAAFASRPRETGLSVAFSSVTSEFPHTQTVLWVHLWLGAGLGDCAFSISVRHKLKNALMMIGTIGPLELAGLAATYASTCRTRSVSVELARHRWKAVLTG